MKYVLIILIALLGAGFIGFAETHYHAQQYHEPGYGITQEDRDYIADDSDDRSAHDLGYLHVD